MLTAQYDRAASSQTVVLKLTSAVAIAGRIIRAGELVEVTKLEAADLVQRRRAVVVGSDDPADFDDQDDQGDTAPETAQDAASEPTADQAGEDAGQPADAPQDAAQEAPQAAGRRRRAK